jgi:hypothetical protein
LISKEQQILFFYDEYSKIGMSKSPLKPGSPFSTLAAPAQRVLANAGIATLAQLAQRTEAEVLKLHGMGPGSMPKLCAALAQAGLTFKP